MDHRQTATRKLNIQLRRDLILQASNPTAKGVLLNFIEAIFQHKDNGVHLGKSADQCPKAVKHLIPGRGLGYQQLGVSEAADRRLVTYHYRRKEAGREMRRNLAIEQTGL